MTATMQTLLSDLRRRFMLAGLESPALDARILVRKVFRTTDADMIAGDDRPATAQEIAELESMAARRLAGQPVSRIMGVREFWGMNFAVTPAVLDPRPDTETLVAAAVDALSASPPQAILDLGTGSGCLLVALLKEFTQARGTGVDISVDALAVARRNAESNGVADRAAFVQSRWCDSITGRFDLIVSNPPYIPHADIESLEPEVRNHDPILALSGGGDGLDAYRSIVREIGSHLNRDGLCYLEIGINQAENVARLVEESNLSVRRIIPDIAGIPRAVEITRGDN